MMFTEHLVPTPDLCVHKIFFYIQQTQSNISVQPLNAGTPDVHECKASKAVHIASTSSKIQLLMLLLLLLCCVSYIRKGKCRPATTTPTTPSRSVF